MQRASFFGCNEKTVQKWTWLYAEAIALREGEKVRKICLASLSTLLN